MEKGSLNKLAVLAVFVAFVSSSCAGSCSRMFGENKGGVSVMVEEVKVVESSPVTTVSGKLVPNDKTDISFLNDVKVQETYVQVGTKVNAGDSLFRLADDELTHDLNSAKARKTELELLIEKNTSLMRGRERLLEEGKVEQDELSRLEKEISINEAELERIKADITRLTYNLEHALVTSPIAGVVTAKNIGAGSLAKTGDVLISLVDVNPIIVSFPLSAKQSGDVAIDMPLKVFVNELPDKTFTASVKYISPDLHKVGSAFDVWAAIPNDDFMLKAGMGVSTEFVSDTPKKTYIVPASAILSLSSEPYVYKVGRGIAHKTPVVVGAVAENQAEIVRGLVAGDLVVVKGGEGIFDGADVSIWSR